MSHQNPKATESTTLRFRGGWDIQMALNQFRRDGHPLMDLEEIYLQLDFKDDFILDVVRNERTGSLSWKVSSTTYSMSSIPSAKEEISFRGRLELTEGLLTYNNGYGEDAFLTGLVAMLPDPELATFTIHFGQKGYPTTWSLETENHLFTRKVNLE